MCSVIAMLCVHTSIQVQPSTKAFPTCTRCFPQSDSDYYPPLVRMFQARRLLECLLLLLTAPSTALELRVFSAVRELLLHFMNSLNGLLFLSSSPGVMATVVRSLTQAVETELPLSAMQPLSVSACVCVCGGSGFLYNIYSLPEICMFVIIISLTIHNYQVFFISSSMAYPVFDYSTRLKIIYNVCW